MYKLVKPLFDNKPSTSVQRLSDEAFIPFDPVNKDYQEYLKWVAEGNTPQPVDQPN